MSHYKLASLLFSFILITTLCFAYIKSNKVIKKQINIQEALDYPIPEVIQRFMSDYDIGYDSAKLYERELKRYLILSAKNYPAELEMFSPEVDALWHTFIIFTKEYENYCNRVLGCFVHHYPGKHNLLKNNT